MTLNFLLPSRPGGKYETNSRDAAGSPSLGFLARLTGFPLPAVPEPAKFQGPRAHAKEQEMSSTPRRAGPDVENHDCTESRGDAFKKPFNHPLGLIGREKVGKSAWQARAGSAAPLWCRPITSARRRRSPARRPVAGTR